MSLPNMIVEKLSKKNRAYTRVELDDHALKDNDIIELVKLLQNNPYVKQLSLRRNNLSDKSINAFIGLPSTIEYIDLSANNLDDDAADAILEIFNKIKQLDISNNGFTNKSAMKFSRHATQEYLKIVGNEIDAEYQEMLDVRIKQNIVAQNPSSTEILTKKLTSFGERSIENLCNLIEDPAQKLVFFNQFGIKNSSISKS